MRRNSGRGDRGRLLLVRVHTQYVNWGLQVRVRRPMSVGQNPQQGLFSADNETSGRPGFREGKGPRYDRVTLQASGGCFARLEVVMLCIGW